jgi:chemotaxis protein CheD
VSSSNIPILEEYFLNPGYIYIPRRPTLISSVVGTCVVVCIWDRKREYGGMSHFLYPRTAERRQATPQYGNVAVQALVRLFVEEGSRKKHLRAQIFGGAHPADGSPVGKRIGRDNVAMARKILIRHEITIVSEDVGGSEGRKLIYNTFNNEAAVLRVDRLRSSDWYPYENNR